MTEAEPEPELRLIDDAISLVIDVRVYRRGAVKKPAYRLADRCTAILGVLDDHLLPVSLRIKPGTAESTAREAARAFFQELLDQELLDLSANRCRRSWRRQSRPMRALAHERAISGQVIA